MNMSLHPIAEAVRSQGRNGDSMLVHMTPGEVAALQRMAEANGGTLTINPETGQPEAFFLAALLPTIAGAMAPSLAGMGGIMGTLFGSPLMSSLTIGGLTGLVTGDMEQGLMAGLGAYGGYGLGQSLMGAGTTPAVTAAGPTAPVAPKPPVPAQAVAQPVVAPPVPAGAALPPQGIMQAAPDALTQAGQVAQAGQAGQAAQGIQGAMPVDPAIQNAVARQAALTPPPAAAMSADPTILNRAQGYGAYTPPPSMEEALGRAGASAKRMGQGIANVASGEVPGGTMGFLKDNAMDIGMAAAPMVSAALKKDDKEEEVKKDTEQYYYPDFTLGRATPEQIAAQRASFGAGEAGLPYSTKEVNYYPGFSYGERKTRNVAGGGLMSLAEGGAPSYKKGGLKKDSFIVPADVLAALGNGSNDAGLMALNKMLAKVGAPRAEKIDGPGDGMSDSIPTSIEGKQPARVAKDEAYVPTEAVRRLGGGDVKKGAKKLYNLMARVRKAAHGDDKQQRQVNPDKVARA